MALCLLQGQAEFYLEKLHGEVEKQLESFLKSPKPQVEIEWRKFREMLIGLTDVTHSHFVKLVKVRKQSQLKSSTMPSFQVCLTSCWLVLFRMQDRDVSKIEIYNVAPWHAEVSHIS